ncbi:hypothetical protein [uncultured Sulfitobacter sp.]|uniref:hypothetical protein n=1 Tax=uncultured Sulfitobacter sp. TaxID=191468 RepID=UPI00262D50E4|nr:hypothetical protein [uncultured Sulfitobacter sp.]
MTDQTVTIGPIRPDGLPVAPEPFIPRGHSYSRQAAYFVSAMSTLFVLGLLGYLFYSAYMQSSQIFSLNGDGAAALKSGDALHPSFMELEYQKLKNARIGHALLYRFSISVAAIVVSLTTIVLGSVLIFDRVFSTDLNALDAKYPQGIALNAQSPFPGLIMIFLGTFSLLFSVYYAGPGAARVVTVDVPVFTRDLNPQRYNLNIHSAIDTNSTKDDTEATGTSEIDYDFENLKPEQD